ncbi:MAG: hypothetical protein V7637_578 [Mycobacteriales bacterium]|jgi:hypothetical protein
MSPTAAFAVLTWVAIVLLFLGLGAVLREVRLLRALVSRDPDGFTAAQPELTLGGSFAGPPADPAGPGAAGPRMVVAADTGCGLCVTVVRRLADRGATATVLTHEPAAAWAGLAGQLPVVTDRDAWRAISHLSPPVLMLVDPAGAVHKLLLPVRAEQADRAAVDWGAAAADEPERTPDAVDR